MTVIPKCVSAQNPDVPKSGVAGGLIGYILQKYVSIYAYMQSMLVNTHFKHSRFGFSPSLSLFPLSFATNSSYKK